MKSLLTVGVDDDQLVLDSVVGFGTSDSLEEEGKGDSGKRVTPSIEYAIFTPNNNHFSVYRKQYITVTDTH